VKALFDEHKAAIVVYNKKLKDPFEAEVLDVQIEAVELMLGTGVLRKLNKGDTKKRDAFMVKETPILNDLEYKIKLCIADGTIEDSLESFGLGAFRKGIRDNNINLFHTSYESTIARVNIAENTAALEAVDFTADNIIAITTQHDGAWDLNTTKINLKLEINSLSVANQLLVMALLGTCQQILDAIHAYAASINDKILMKQATYAAVLKSVVPTLAKKPRKRKIAVASSIILNTDLVAKNIMQLTSLTDVDLEICLVENKTDSCVVGTPLVFKTLLELKKKDLHGTGRYVKITNKSTTKKAVVLYFEVVVVLP
jgi:hypothetical protein